MRIMLIRILLLSTLAFAATADSRSFNKALLAQHNVLRAKHGVPPLVWSENVAKVAQDWANTNARQDSMHHRRPNKYGENIFWMSGAEPTGAMVADNWYDEIKDYHYSSPGFSMNTGHFTQVVWKDTKEIGCGSAKSAAGGTYVVCNYNPPGNYSGRFPENVPKPK